MSTYRFGYWKTWDGVNFFSIDKKTFFGWSEQKYWVVKWDDSNKKSQEKLMMEAVDRLIKAGHTVL